MGVIGQHCAAVAISAKVFAGVEAETRRVSQAAGPFSLIAGAMGLGRVLDNLELIPGGQGIDRVHVRRLPVKMNRHDRLRARGNRPFDEARVDIIGVRRRFHRHRGGAVVGNGEPRGDVGIGRHNHLIPLADTVSAQNEGKSIKTIAHPYAVVCPAVGGEFLFKGSDLGPQDIPAAQQHPAVGGVQFLPQFLIGAAEIKKGDVTGHGRIPWPDIDHNP